MLDHLKERCMVSRAYRCPYKCKVKKMTVIEVANHLNTECQDMHIGCANCKLEMRRLNKDLHKPTTCITQLQSTIENCRCAHVMVRTMRKFECFVMIN